jgi:hypothetical protein
VIIEKTLEAPEILQGVGVSQAVDVYGFGMLLWTLYNETIPFGEDQPTPEDIIGGKRPEWKAGTPPGLIEFADRCWDVDPSKRPTAGDIVRRLCDSPGIFGQYDEKIVADVVRHVRSSD